MTFDQSNPNTKVGPTLTNVSKSHGFCQNSKIPTQLSCTRLQAKSFNYKKIGFDLEMQNPHDWKFSF